MIIELNMYLVPLSKNQFAVVDTEGWQKVKNYKWYYGHSYAIRDIWFSKLKKKKKIMMHRFLMDTPEHLQCDHINGDRLDNRYSNLRNCTLRQNNMNRKKSEGTSSRYKGVSWCKEREKWEAHIKVHGKKITIGRFDEEWVAAKLYDIAALYHFGEFAKLNNIQGE